MMEKVEQFLFDILGLLIPGLITIIILFLSPLLIIDFDRISSLINSSPDLNMYIETIIIFYEGNKSIVITLFLIISYIIGHVIKVLSKYPYSFLKIIFDEGIFKVLNFTLKFIIKIIRKISSTSDSKPNFLLYLFDRSYRKPWEDKIKSENLNIWYINIVNFFVSIYCNFFKKLLTDIFSFNTPNYYNSNDNIKSNVIQKLNHKYKVNFPDDWYSIYKISNVILSQENIASLSFKFLAKYNFYRSLSFIFLFNSFYIITLYNILNESVSNLGQNIFLRILLINSLLWFAFHEKYKRYWTLCGNESLMNLFYFLSKSNYIEDCEVETNEG